MKTFRNFIFCLFLFFHCTDSFSQNKPSKEEIRDSLQLYKNIENYSQKRGFTRFLHKLIFRPITSRQKVSKNTFQQIKKKPVENVEGKIIRKINITTLDPFGYSELDSTRTPSRWVQKTGNSIHNKTKILAIKNLLLIKRNTPLDSLLVKESTRLIRSQRFVRAVTIESKTVSSSSDSVDVNIRVLDSWSLIPNFTASSNSYSIDLNERNFLGTGHQFRNTYRKDLEYKREGYRAIYSIPNILNTYIRTTISYDKDLDFNYTKILDVERPFFSPLTRWAAGIHFDQIYRQPLVIDTNNNFEFYERYKYNTVDIWGGHSYQIFQGSSEKSRTTNLITSARYLKINYLQKPVSDTVNYFSDENFYLVGIGISSRQFTQDKYIFNYQIIEDVPSGVVYGLTGGYQLKNNRFRYYFGARFAYGKYYKWGYLSTNIEYGSFYKNSSEQSAIIYNFIYFTNLIETRRWKFRQFVKPELIIGNRRLASDHDRLNLNDAYGIQGFDSPNLFGTKRVTMSFQTQAYSPWNFWGFRLNPYLNTTFGMLGNASSGLKNCKVYSQFGLGVILSNDYLIFNSFQISFAYYPTIPGKGDNILKTNAYTTEDFGLQDFNFAKPVVVPYQ